MRIRIIALLLSCALIPALSGCGLFSSGADKGSRPGSGVALLAENPVSLHNYRIAREYATAGRFELAREHYLLAYASAEDAAVKDMLSKELDAVDLMIRTLR